MQRTPSTTNRGVSFVEIIVAAAIIMVLVGTVISVYNLYLSRFDQTTASIKASYLTQEGVEAIKTFRDESWSNNIAPLDHNTKYYLTFSTSSSSWATTTDPFLVDGTYKRWVELEKVYRDSEDDIAASGTNDPDTKKVTVHVAWDGISGTTTKETTTYITNLFDN